MSEDNVKKERHVMLDIETLHTVPGGVILQVGAVEFDPGTGDTGASYIANIRVDSSIKAGLNIKGDTLKWWMNQSEAARKSLYDPAPVNLESAMGGLNSFLADATVWCHATFDLPFVAVALEAAGFGPSWKYNAYVDLRTLWRLTGFDAMTFNESYSGEEETGAAHSALGDCRRQAKAVKAAYDAAKARGLALP